MRNHRIRSSDKYFGPGKRAHSEEALDYSETDSTSSSISEDHGEYGESNPSIDSLLVPAARSKRRKMQYMSFDNLKIRALRLDDLPTEILREIFVYSGNLELPQISIHAARKLYHSKSLERRLMGEYMDDGTLYVEACLFPFVTEELLEGLDIVRIGCLKAPKKEPSSIYVPRQLEEDDGDQRVTGILAFLIMHKCQIEDSGLMYARMIRANRLDVVEYMLNERRPANHTAVIGAINQGNEHLASRLVVLIPGYVGKEQVWSLAEAKGFQTVLNHLMPYMFGT